jgi:hypothetical protein
VVHFDPSVKRKGPFELLYFSVLARIPLLQRLLPCSAHFVFTRSA